MDARALALAFSISTRTLETLIARGEVPPFIRIGKQRRWRQKEVADWIKAKQSETPTRLAHGEVENRTKESNVVVATSAVQEWKRQVAEAHVYDTMTPDEKSAERKLLAQDVPKRAAGQKVVRLKRDASSKQSMLGALESLMSNL